MNLSVCIPWTHKHRKTLKQFDKQFHIFFFQLCTQHDNPKYQFGNAKQSTPKYHFGNVKQSTQQYHG